jgi:hypothetical protein
LREDDLASNEEFRGGVQGGGALGLELCPPEDRYSLDADGEVDEELSNQYRDHDNSNQPFYGHHRYAVAMGSAYNGRRADNAMVHESGLGLALGVDVGFPWSPVSPIRLK